MVKVWQSYKDVDEAIKTIKTIMQIKGELPNELAESIKATIKTSSKGIIQYFYSKLVEECPEAIKYF